MGYHVLIPIQYYNTLVSGFLCKVKCNTSTKLPMGALTALSGKAGVATYFSRSPNVSLLHSIEMYRRYKNIESYSLISQRPQPLNIKLCCNLRFGVISMPSRLEKMAKEWSIESKMGLKSKLKDIIYPPPPMRQRIAMALYRIKIQVNRLEHMLCRLQERDKVLFEKVIDAQMAKDTARATIYANEVAEIRKIAKTLLRAQLALEQIALRLETIQELGDIIVTMAPIVNVIKDLKKQLMGVVPEIAFELSEIDELLHSVIIEAGEFTGHTVDFTVASSEAKKILEEASVIAEQRMKEKFPELPSATSVSGEKLPTPPKQS